MTRSKRPGVWLVMAAVLSLAVAAGAGMAAYRVAAGRIIGSLDQSLVLTRRAVEAEIERFRFLPRLAQEDARVRAAVRTPGDAGAIAAANRYLENAARLSGAAELLLIDSAGTTIAASASEGDGSYVGENYAFRPYFHDAMATGTGRFYGIGVTTGQPGYFLASRLDLPTGEAAVVSVKIDLLPLQAAWRDAGAATALADGEGVIFLAGNPDWLYRPLFPLSESARRRLEDTRAYFGEDPGATTPLVATEARESTRTLITEEGRDLPMRRLDIPAEGWTLVSAASLAPAVTSGWAAAVIAALATLAAMAAGQAIAQRRRLGQLRLRQNEILERRVKARTGELAREVEVRTRTEEDLRAAQNALVHSEKMAALGRMSAAIVHEISQPLAAMEASLAATVISRKVVDASTARRIDSARGHIRRMQRIIKDLRTFSRKERPERRPTSVENAVRNALELLAPRAQPVPVEIAFRCEGPIPAILANQMRLEQVFVNVLLNAIDALEGCESPSLAIEARSVGGRVCVTVADNGCGIPEPLLERITEPFFTTKTGGEGLGLGLSITQTIVEGFGGALDIVSSPAGEGTRFTVSFPIPEEQTVAGR